MQTILGQFDDISRAQEAIEALLQRKYDKSDISFIARDPSGETAVTEASAPSAAGAAVVGLLAGLGTLAIPYIGPILAAGPMAVGLAGTSAGAAKEDAANWLGGVLGKVGVPGSDASNYGQAVQRGGAVVVVRAGEGVAANISAILEGSGASVVRSYERGED